MDARLVEHIAMVALNNPKPAPTVVTRSIIKRPTPEPPPTPPTSSDSDSDTENNDRQNENVPLNNEDDEAASPVDIGEEDTVPLLMESSI